MIFEETNLSGAWLIKPERLVDSRGFFARVWCEKEAATHQLNTRWVQSSISYNARPATLRGMHFQLEPAAETKLVRCTMGAIFDVIIDLRADSPTYLKWFATDLTAENRQALYIPGGFAHGFQTRCPNTEILYQMDTFYAPELARGLRWDDPQFNIPWPEKYPVISPKDAQLPRFDAAQPPFFKATISRP